MLRVVGGRRIDFRQSNVTHVDRESNRTAWLLLRDRIHRRSFEWLNCFFEQHLLMACLDYHRLRKESPYFGMQIEYLFSSFINALERRSASPIF
jgi:hypothetical protein